VSDDQGPPPYDVLAALVVLLRAELAVARVELERARERVAELEARLRQSPRNSSKPPSSEGLGKPPRKRSLRKKTGRKPGGQTGHEGKALAQVARPDREIRHEPAACSRCGAGLAGRPVTGVERRQVFDLPPIKIEVTEHQLIERECGCGQRTKGTAPAQATAPVCYGPRVAAVTIYLYIGQFLSKKQTQLCCAHVLRELQAVTDAAPSGEWCWATQVADAITKMQALVCEAIAQGQDTVNPDALAAQARNYRSAALIGVG
jgi:transposase